MYITIFKLPTSNAFFIEVHYKNYRTIFGFHSKYHFMHSGLAYPSNTAKHPREIIGCIKKYYQVVLSRDIDLIHQQENIWQGDYYHAYRTKYKYKVTKVLLTNNPLGIKLCDYALKPDF